MNYDIIIRRLYFTTWVKERDEKINNGRKVRLRMTMDIKNKNYITQLIIERLEL